MAISLVGVAEASQVGEGTYSLTLPGGLAQNDVVYLYSTCAAAIGAIAPSSAGWTLVDADTNGNCFAGVYRKTMGASPDSSVTISDDSDSGVAQAVVCIALRGVDTATPEDATPTQATGSGTNPNPPAIDTVTPGAWVLPFAASVVTDASVVAPTNYTNQVDINANDTLADITAAGATREIASPTTENPGTWTSWSAGQWLCFTVAVRPAVTGTIPRIIANYRRRRNSDN
jgi:hypothetical protein